MNEETREIKWVFNGINLPDSASDLEGSNGHLWYSVEMNDLQEGDQIINQGFIYFDQNPAIETNLSLHTISGPVGLADSYKEVAVALFPNPAQNRLTIQSAAHIGNYRVFDLQGRRVAQGKLSAKTGQINISELDKGLLYLSLRNQEGAIIARKKFVKL
jgi:hypothetical protein